MQPRQDDSELITQYLLSHDPGAREEIILRYVPLVHYVLGRIGISQNLGQDYEDAVGQGILGLIEALDRYDPSHGTQFSTYATLRIRGKVIDHLRSHDWLSRSARSRARQVQQALEELWGKLQRVPTDEELATHLNYDLPQLKQALVDSSQVFISLDSIVANEGDETVTLHEILSNEEQLGPADIFDEQEIKYYLIDTLRHLPEREQLVLALYYDEELTFKEIGAVLKVSESRVCQIHARAVMTLRAKMHQLTFDYDNQASRSGLKDFMKRRALPDASLIGGYEQ
jgi:RNA polymerase sigma factor for flagellar operon FliA